MSAGGIGEKAGDSRRRGQPMGFGGIGRKAGDRCRREGREKRFPPSFSTPVAGAKNRQRNGGRPPGQSAGKALQDCEASSKNASGAPRVPNGRQSGGLVPQKGREKCLFPSLLALLKGESQPPEKAGDHCRKSGGLLPQKRGIAAAKAGVYCRRPPQKNQCWSGLAGCKISHDSYNSYNSYRGGPLSGVAALPPEIGRRSQGETYGSPFNPLPSPVREAIFRKP
jgi:hypothetical protein